MRLPLEGLAWAVGFGLLLGVGGSILTIKRLRRKKAQWQTPAVASALLYMREVRGIPALEGWLRGVDGLRLRRLFGRHPIGGHLILAADGVRFDPNSEATKPFLLPWSQVADIQYRGGWQRGMPRIEITLLSGEVFSVLIGRNQPGLRSVRKAIETRGAMLE